MSAPGESCDVRYALHSDGALSALGTHVDAPTASEASCGDELHGHGPIAFDRGERSGGAGGCAGAACSADLSIDGYETGWGRWMLKPKIRPPRQEGKASDGRCASAWAGDPEGPPVNG
ncbi:MAG: hypothetical protein Kow0010_21290 [Dehalococcoidia bacterium]